MENGVVDSLKPERILYHIEAIAQFHRIQGSRGLVEAVKYVQENLSAWGLESKLYTERYDGKSWYLTLQSPIAWNLIDGEIRFGEKKLGFEDTPLVVMAHSPSGEGEAEVLPILKEEDWKDADGKAVLVGRNWRDAYKRANEAGASAFIAYREGTGNAVPYIGLFLTEEELEWAKIPSFAVPESWAKEMISKHLSGKKPRLKFRAETEVKPSEKLPVLYAEVGEPPFILFTAHICHPKPGANDNASGSAMLMELARVLSRAYRNDFRFGFAFLWIPEYYGTQAFVERYAELDRYYSVINLDMVGGSEDRSGSTVMLVRTPLSRFSVLSGVLEYFLNKYNLSGRKSFSGSEIPLLKAYPYAYEMGSDHDVFNFFGVPAVMPITWPDRFYHSSMDTPEKISLDSLAVIGRAVLASALFLAGEDKKRLKGFARGYSLKYLGELSMEGETEVAEKLVMRGLSRDSEFLDINLGHRFETAPWIEWKIKGRLGRDIINAKVPEKVEEFKKLTEDRRVIVHLHELLMLGEILPEEEAYRALSEEYRKTDREKLGKLVGILEEGGIIKKQS